MIGTWTLSVRDEESGVAGHLVGECVDVVGCRVHEAAVRCVEPAVGDGAPGDRDDSVHGLVVARHGAGELQAPGA